MLNFTLQFLLNFILTFTYSKLNKNDWINIEGKLEEGKCEMFVKISTPTLTLLKIRTIIPFSY